MVAIADTSVDLPIARGYEINSDIFPLAYPLYQLNFHRLISFFLPYKLF